MNENKLKRALGSVEKSAEAIQNLVNLVMNLRLDAYGDLRMLRDSKLDFSDEELDRVTHLYNRLKTEAEVTIEQLNDIIEAHEPND